MALDQQQLEKKMEYRRMNQCSIEDALPEFQNLKALSDIETQIAQFSVCFLTKVDSNIQNIVQKTDVYAQQAQAIIKKYLEQFELQLKCREQLNQVMHQQVNDKHYTFQVQMLTQKMDTNKQTISEDQQKISEVTKTNLNAAIQIQQNKGQTATKKVSGVLRANLEMCNLLSLSLLQKNCEHSEVIERFYYSKCFYYCQSCMLTYRTKKSKSEYKAHMKTKHKHQAHQNIIKFASIFEMEKEKILAGSLVLRKCGCSKQLFSSDESYVGHILKEHQGYVPKYSSHLFESSPQSCRLYFNPNFNQLAVLEEQLLSEIYLCGFCPEIHFSCKSEFITHLQDAHPQATSHPWSSHFLDYSTDLLTHNEHLEVESKKDFCKAQKQIKKARKSKKSQTKVECDQPIIEDPFCPYSVFKDIVDRYEGPYACSLCDSDLETHQKLVWHFESQQFCHNHFQSNQSFIKVIIRDKKLNTGNKLILLVPKTGHEFDNIPIKYWRHKKQEFQWITYLQFIHLLQRKTNFKNMVFYETSFSGNLETYLC